MNHDYSLRVGKCLRVQWGQAPPPIPHRKFRRVQRRRACVQGGGGGKVHVGQLQDSRTARRGSGQTRGGGDGAGMRRAVRDGIQEKGAAGVGID